MGGKNDVSKASKTPATLTKRRVARALAKMSPELTEIYEALGAKLRRADDAECQRRYQAGELVNQAKDGKLGTNAVKLLAAALGKDEDTLYDMGKVAARWSPATYAKLLARPTAHRTAISFSHFILLAKVESDARRDELLELVFEQGLSVRALRRITKPKQKQEGGGTGKGPVALLRRHARQVDAIVRWLEGTGRPFAASTRGRAALGDAIAQQRALLERMETALAGTAPAVTPPESQRRETTKTNETSETSRKSLPLLFGGGTK